MSEQISNVSFVLGTAEQVPFEDSSFDVVMSRLALPVG
ncbi:methyltransferase domain-containing protein [Mobiluncus curtisii]|nr:class I SAM-dependent methyltransferase [Mobiluncus curtisii]MCV0021482.1 class I SAM-dependent methyltransferase [Mobiluncus curtisii]NMW47218.1 class I SAM-dependent methyltransferase [Mobiluncus curtisii]